MRKALKISLLRNNYIEYTKHKIGEEALYSFQALWYAKTIAFIEKPLYNYVQRGDNLYNLAREYNTTVSEIKKLNNLTSDLLSIGQSLLLPA